MVEVVGESGAGGPSLGRYPRQYQCEELSGTRQQQAASSKQRGTRVAPDPAADRALYLRHGRPPSPVRGGWGVLWCGKGWMCQNVTPGQSEACRNAERATRMEAENTQPSPGAHADNPLLGCMHPAGRKGGPISVATGPPAASAALGASAGRFKCRPEPARPTPCSGTDRQPELAGRRASRGVPSGHTGSLTLVLRLLAGSAWPWRRGAVDRGGRRSRACAPRPQRLGHRLAAARPGGCSPGRPPTPVCQSGRCVGLVNE